MVPPVDSSKPSKRYFKLEKLVCIELVDEKNQIKSIKITGDFFLHPEEKIDSIEAGLVGVQLKKESIKKKLESLLSGCEFYGFDIESLSEAIMQCVEENNH